MLETQDIVQIKHYTHLRTVLDKSMVLGSPKQDKFKQGYLTAKTKNGNWKEQYLVLSSKYIVGYRLKNKVRIIVVVCLFVVVNVCAENAFLGVVIKVSCGFTT